MAFKKDSIHLKKIDSVVQPDNTSYATVRIDELGRVVYNDENGEKSLAYIEDISGGSGFTPLEGEGITITPVGDDFEFSVDDYISGTEVVNMSSSLQSRINDKQEMISILEGDGISIIEDPSNTWTISVSGDFANNLEVETSLNGAFMTSAPEVSKVTVC